MANNFGWKHTETIPADTKKIDEADFKRFISKLKKEKLQVLYEHIDDFFNEPEKYGLLPRDGQYSMALSVFDSIESNDDLIIEAGVGIGKSYAYLVPLLYLNQLQKKPFIISTSTIALQEQLEKDINTLSKQLGIDIDVVIAKGKGNFLCKNRLNDFLSYGKNKEYIDRFSDNKQDRRNYPDIKDSIWKQINVDTCDYSRCTNYSTCEFAKRRKDMRNTDGAIICNHDLLIEDLSRYTRLDNQLLKHVDHIVCDEAHNLESKIRNAKTREINLHNTKKVLEKALLLLDKVHVQIDKYNSIYKQIDKLGLIIDKNVLSIIGNLKEKGIEIEDCNGLELTFTDDVLALASNIYEKINEITSAIQIHVTTDTDLIEEQLYNFMEDYKYLSEGINSNELFWIECRNNKNYIYHAPKRIDEIAFDLFFKYSIKNFIFTSATLCTKNNDYNYFINSIGANYHNHLVVEDSYESPYDYDNNTLLYCCNDISSPKLKDKYLDELVNKIKELVLLTDGKAMVLFTSKHDMNYVYNQIGKKLNGLDVYIQNDGSSQDIIKEKFKNNTNSILFSTGIFWEGIDIKGESLSNLIIARLPFPVVDPIIEYKSSLYENGFKEVYIPEMLIKLKQGVGRLIRSETDKGIVSILDSRVSKYEDIIKETLPIKNFTSNMDDVKEFVKKIKN